MGEDQTAEGDITVRGVVNGSNFAKAAIARFYTDNKKSSKTLKSQRKQRLSKTRLVRL